MFKRLGGNSMDANQYLEIFVEESKENLQNMNSNLLYLRQSKIIMY